MISDDRERLILQGQRRLREKLLGRRSLIQHPATRDLTAHLLLYVDSAPKCWELAAEWLRREMDADRADGGFASAFDLTYSAHGQSLRSDRSVPSILGLRMEMTDPIVRSIWSRHEPILFNSIIKDPRFSPKTRADLAACGVRSKITIVLRGQCDQPVGLMCADSLDEDREWRQNRCLQFKDTAAQVIGPVLSLAKLIAQKDFSGCIVPAKSS